MDLIFATHNEHKVAEVQAMLPSAIRIRSLREMGCLDEIPETHHTLKGNALQKARFVAARYNAPCFADDTGLEIDALEGRPGVYSARYAGEGCTFADNVRKVLDEMRGITAMSARSARFRTVVALIMGGQEYFFEGKVEGFILPEPSGHEGFGYDPVFLPAGWTKSFAEMDAADKNRISHRGQAIGSLVEFLKRLP